MFIWAEGLAWQKTKAGIGSKSFCDPFSFKVQSWIGQDLWALCHPNPAGPGEDKSPVTNHPSTDPVSASRALPTLPEAPEYPSLS